MDGLNRNGTRGRIRAWLGDLVGVMSLAAFGYGLLFLPLVFE